MINFLLRAMLARSSRNLLLILGLLALSSGLSTYVSANQSASVKVAATLDENWRGSFDILVRPKEAIKNIELEHQVVESNYLSASGNGISVAQWKQIQQLPAVQVAAPIATIGYLRGYVPFMIMRLPAQEQTSTLKVQLGISSTNGYRSTTVVDDHQYYVIKPPSRPVSLSQQAPAGYKIENPVLLATSTGASVFSDGSVDLHISSLPTIWTQLAAIDPAAERELSGVDQSLIDGKYLASNDGYATVHVPTEDEDDKRIAEAKTEAEKVEAGHISIDNARRRSYNPSGPDLPIIYAASTYVSLPTTIKVDELQLVDTSTLEVAQQYTGYVPSSDPKQDRGADLRQYLDNLNIPSVRSIISTTIDYGNVIKPISMRALTIDLRGQQPVVDTASGRKGWLTKGTDSLYLPGSISYRQYTAPFDTNGLLTIAAETKLDTQTIISVTGETAFRSLPLVEPATKVQHDKDKGSFSLNEVGSYDLNKLPESVRNPNPLTYVPLGIYTPPTVKLVRDAAGKELPGGPVTLHPTINPASFIPGPPLALTNIAAARFFRGDNCIDAIRVRVAGIDKYTPQNVKKVEAVAAEIIAATGLHVDIVSGSSPQQVLVYIPGSADGKVAPLGYVEEQWTTLGAAANISGGIDSASVLMLVVTGLAGLLYLLSQSLLSTLSRRRELALLQAIGWRRRHISGLVIGEAAVLGLLGGVTAIILALLIARLLNLAAPPEQAVAVGAVVFSLYLLASIGPAWWVVRQPVAELLQRGEVVAPVGSGRVLGGGRLLGGVGWPGLAAFAWRNLSRRRLRSILAAGGIAIATTLLMLISASLVALSGTLRVTLLGQFVGLQVQPYHYIMVGSALVVSVLTVADHLAVGVLERRHELALLQAMGWRAGAVRFSLLLEGVWLGLFGGLVGAVAAVGVGLATKSQLILAAWWVVPASLLVIILLCSLSALYAISLTPRQQLVSVMQQQR